MLKSGYFWSNHKLKLSVGFREGLGLNAKATVGDCLQGVAHHDLSHVHSFCVGFILTDGIQMGHKIISNLENNMKSI